MIITILDVLIITCSRIGGNISNISLGNMYIICTNNLWFSPEQTHGKIGERRREKKTEMMSMMSDCNLVWRVIHCQYNKLLRSYLITSEWQGNWTFHIWNVEYYEPSLDSDILLFCSQYISCQCISKKIDSLFDTFF